ncbi:MAG: hypothetical protein V3W18_06410 [candidate division Zixibacteria bacterium]
MTGKNAGEMAKKFAPIFAQKVSEEWILADQIAPLDLSKSIANVAKNPDTFLKLISPDKFTDVTKENLLNAKVYFSVCETHTHYFIVYAVYHVLDWYKRFKPNNIYDWIRDKCDEHVHDMEGALFVISKTNDIKGKLRLDGLITVSHHDFYLYTEPLIIDPSQNKDHKRAYGRKNLRIVNFRESVDGNIWIDKNTKRPKLYIQSRGHGIRGDHEDWGGGDQIWYYQLKSNEKPAGTSDASEKTRPVDYLLEDIFKKDGLWENRTNDRVFIQGINSKWSFAVIKNGDYVYGKANPPWSWNDRNDTSPMGEIATDPASFIIRYAQGWGPVSTQYLYNPYQNIGY